jgi:hypothetical protein
VYQLIEKFCTGLGDSSAAISATESCTVEQPGAGQEPLAATIKMTKTALLAFPDWSSKVVFVADNKDGTYAVGTQQCFGLMKFDLGSMGTFPAVTLANASEQATTIECNFPVEVGVFTLNEDKTKVAAVVYDGDIEPDIEETDDDAVKATQWVEDRWDESGEFDDTGFGMLLKWVGVDITPPAIVATDVAKVGGACRC